MLCLTLSVTATVLILQSLHINCQEPCDSSVYRTIEGEDKRSSDYTLDSTHDNAFSDDRLTTGWYRVLNHAGENMATEAPGVFRCGSWYPIWLNGQAPQVENEVVTRPVCLQTFVDECHRTWDIQIKRCSGGYLVYELQPSPVIDSAYCFGSSTPCPANSSSETGFTPCHTDFPRTTFVPVVQVSRKEGDLSFVDDYKILEPVFSCSFSDTGHVYDIHWFINGYGVKTVKNIQYSSISQSDLRPADWKDTHHMNMHVKCTVRCRNSASSTPGYHQTSTDFVAGVIPDSYSLEVDEGGNVTFNLRSTVPTGCVASVNLKVCKETIKIGYPKSSLCSTNSSDIITETCGTDITSLNWNAPASIIVYGNMDGMYNSEITRTTSISFEHTASDKDFSGAWDKLVIPDVTVYIKDKDTQLSGRYCVTNNDPNYLTFDHRFFSHQISGEHVLYRHKREPYWVHSLTSACWRGTCNVGVAIRSHDSLFVLRTVDTVNNPVENSFTATFSGSRDFPMMDFRSCDDKNMLISRESRSFKVSLPSGTIITFRVTNSGRFYFLNHINVHPSVSDIGQTEGLCGFLSNDGQDRRDDLQERGTENVVPLNIFIQSWTINRTSGESLFSSSPSFQTTILNKPFCTCKRVAVGTEKIANEFNEVNCNLTKPMEQCYQTNANVNNNIHTTCSTSRKRRDIYVREDQRIRRMSRSTEDSDDIQDDFAELTFSPDFVEDYFPSDLDWPAGWTNETAFAACTEGFENAIAVRICQEYANIDKEEYIPGCMIDIKATGNTTLLQESINSLTASCIIDISKNQTLLISNSSDDGNGKHTGSLLESIQKLLCINNCSSNGLCNAGKCICNQGFMGEDCSMSNRNPPSALRIPNGGKCGTRQRNCQKTNIYGVFDAEQVWCKIRYFKVVNNVKDASLVTNMVEADIINPVMVSCELPTSMRRKKRSTSNTVAEGYDISLSNDGTNFGDDVTIIIFDEECYSCDAVTVSCVYLDTCPSDASTVQAQSTVVTAGTATKTSDASEMSTENTPNQATSESSGSSMNLIIIGIVVAIVCVGAVIVGIIIYKCKKKNVGPNTGKHVIMQNDTESIGIDDLEGKNNAPTSTQFRTRKMSNLSMDWLHERPKTPEHLFLAK